MPGGKLDEAGIKEFQALLTLKEVKDRDSPASPFKPALPATKERGQERPCI